MTIPATESEISYAGDGVTLAFDIPFPFDTASDLKVISTDADGNPTELTSGFSVSGGNGSTGTLTFLVAPSASVDITILDDVELTQTHDYTDNDPFPAESHETALDRGVRISKRLYQLIRRSIRTRDGDPIIDMELGSVDNRKGKYLFFNAVTGAIEYAVNLVTTALSQSIIAQLLNPQTAAESAAGVTPTNYLYPAGNVLRYGADATGVSDSTSAFQQAINANDYVWVPTGTYLLNQTAVANQLTISRSNVTLEGAGPKTVLTHTATGTVTGNQAVVVITPSTGDISNIRVANLRIVGPTTNTGAAIFGDTRVLGLFVHIGTQPYFVSDVLIESVAIEGMETACFGLSANSTTKYPRRIKFVNCSARTSRQDGFNDFGGQGQDIEIINCEMRDLDGFGAEMACQSLIMDGNRIQRVGQAGIGLEYNATTGVNKRRIIRNNLIADITTAAYPNSAGISLSQSVSPFNTDIHGNEIYRTGGHGIVLNNSPDNINIFDNLIEDVGGGGTNKQGISSGAAVTNTYICGNRIRTAGAGYSMTYGIALAGAGSATNLVQNNEISGYTTVRIAANSPTRLGRSLVPALNTTAVGNVGGGEDDLITYTMPALAMDTDGQVIRISAWGYPAANANNKTLKLYLGALALLDTGAIAANNKPWKIEAYVRRSSVSIAVGSADGQFNGALLATTRGVTGGANFAASTVIKCTGTGTADNDIVQEGLLVEFLDGI